MAETEFHAYESVTLGLPPLRMVLVHAKNDAQNAAAAPSPQPVVEELLPVQPLLDTESAIRRLIERLESIQE